MTIAVLGTGSVGSALAKGFSDAGHEVVFGVRNPDDAKYADLREQFDWSVEVRGMAEACAGADAIVLAVPFAVVGEVVPALGDLTGKVLLDVTNPLKSDFSGLSLPEGDSAGQRIQALAPSAKVVKIFNSVGSNVMSEPLFPDGAASMLLCGDDAAAKQVAAQLASDIGFDPVDVGPLSESRTLEEFCVLWLQLAVAGGLGRDIAFRLMRR